MGLLIVRYIATEMDLVIYNDFLLLSVFWTTLGINNFIYCLDVLVAVNAELHCWYEVALRYSSSNWRCWLGR